MTDSNATEKSPAVHDKRVNEIRYMCGCGAVEHIGNPDPFELLSLYQGSMWATCGECKMVNDLDLIEVSEDER